MLTVAEAGRRGGKARLKKMSPEDRKRISQMGVKARLKKMSPEQRKAVAQNAARTRWAREAEKELNSGPSSNGRRSKKPLPDIKLDARERKKQG